MKQIIDDITGRVIERKLFDFQVEEYIGDDEKFLAEIEKDISAHLNKIVDAASKGFSNSVEFLLSNGANVNEKDKDGNTLLILAAVIEQNIEMVQLLLKHGANVNEKGKDGKAPLFWAAKLGNHKLIELLLEHKADIEGKDDKGVTPLMVAVVNGLTETVQLLLGHEADIEGKNDQGVTPLMMAVVNGNTEMVQFLLSQGAKVNGEKGSKWSPLWAASDETGSVDMVRLLLDAEGIDIDVRHQQYSALFRAVKHGHLEIVRLLLNRGANPVPTTGKERALIEKIKNEECRKLITEAIEYSKLMEAAKTSSADAAAATDESHSKKESSDDQQKANGETNAAESSNSQEESSSDQREAVKFDGKIEMPTEKVFILYVNKPYADEGRVKTEAEKLKNILNDYQAEQLYVSAPIDTDNSVVSMDNLFAQDLYSHFIYHHENFAVPKFPGIGGMAGELVLGF